MSRQVNPIQGYGNKVVNMIVHMYGRCRPLNHTDQSLGTGRYLQPCIAPLEVGLMTSIGVMQATESAGVPPHPPCREDEELSTTSAVIVNKGGFIVWLPFILVAAAVNRQPGNRCGLCVCILVYAGVHAYAR